MIRSKTITMSLSAAIIVGMIGVTGCGTKTDDQNLETKNVKYNTNSTNNRMNNNRYGVNSTNNNRMTRNDNTMRNLRHSKELSDKVAKLKQVDSANVMLTDNNAYVAVSIKNNNTMKNNSLNRNNTGRVQTDMNMNSVGRDGSMMDVGTPTGRGTGAATGIGAGRGAGSNVRNETGGIYPTNRNNGYGTMGTGSRNDEDRTSTGSVGLMRDLANSGTRNDIMGNGNGNDIRNEDQEITQEIKDQIADVIKKSDAKIKNVYVSANPDFVDRVGNFVTDVSNGHPISGVVDEFQSLVNRVFPTPSGNVSNDNNTLNRMGR